jgi:hypothetical protein
MASLAKLSISSAENTPDINVLSNTKRILYAINTMGQQCYQIWALVADAGMAIVYENCRRLWEYN